MKDLNWRVDTRPSGPLLFRSALIAFLLEAILLTAVGWQEHWLSHPQKTTGMDDSRYIEAQMFQIPEQARLVEEKKAPAAPAPQEKAISKVPLQGSTAPQTAASEENQTQSGPKIAATHGPVAIYAPPPVIPSYLQDQELNTSVVIDFFVNSLGSFTPRLVSSSGNEELDAIALAAVKKWQFRPAEKDHQVIDAKVRLRIHFEVK